MKVIDSYGWIGYFSDGPLAKKYASYIEEANTQNTITPSVVVYEVYKQLKKEKGEQVALDGYAQITRTKVVELDAASAIKAADVSLELGLALANAIAYSTAKEHSGQLITNDPNLKALPNVRFIQ